MFMKKCVEKLGYTGLYVFTFTCNSVKLNPEVKLFHCGARSINNCKYTFKIQKYKAIIDFCKLSMFIISANHCKISL